MNRWVDKDPSDVATYSIDWTGAVAAADTIAEAIWFVLPSDLVLEGVTPIVGKTTAVRISEGTAGETYVITCTIILDSSDILERNVMLKVRQQ